MNAGVCRGRQCAVDIVQSSEAWPGLTISERVSETDALARTATCDDRWPHTERRHLQLRRLGRWRLARRWSTSHGLAEDAGVDRIVVNDHVVMGRNTDAYAWGRFPDPPEAPWLEPLTVLTAMAAVTSTDPAVDRHPHRAAAPGGVSGEAGRDPRRALRRPRRPRRRASAGRREEYDAQGLDFADARASCSTTRSRPAARCGRTCPRRTRRGRVSFDDTFCSPQPVQPRLPVWFRGSLTERDAARASSTSATAGSRSWARRWTTSAMGPHARL